MTSQESKLSLTPYRRILQLAHQPGKEEFLKVAAVTGAGSFLVGLIGMLVYAIMLVLPS